MSQYTIRQIPPALDGRLREMSKAENVSLNALVVKLLLDATGLSDEPAVHHDLDELSGTWVDDPEFDKAMLAFESIDEDMWK